MLKYISVLVFAAFILCASFACAETIDISVKGLVCDFCARTIEKSFQRTGKIDKIDVDLDKGQVLIETTPGKEMTDQEIGQLIKDAGYNLVGIKREPGDGR